MSKKARFGLTLMLILAFLLATGATTAKAAGDVTFLGARFVPGKGLMVTLKLSEDADKDQAASAVVNGVTYTMDCRTIETIGKSTILRCSADLARPSGDVPITIWFGSASFATTLSEPRPWCYNVYDFPPSFDPWHFVGTTCQETTAQSGNIIEFANYEWWAVFDYQYWETGDQAENCGPAQPEFGSGFYYNCN